MRAPSLVLINVLGMHNTQMSCQCVVPAEALLLGAQRTVHLLLPGIMDRVLVPGQIVRSREDRVARLARRGVDSLALSQVSMIFHFPRRGSNGFFLGLANGISSSCCTYLVWPRLRITLRR